MVGSNGKYMWFVVKRQNPENHDLVLCAGCMRLRHYEDSPLTYTGLVAIFSPLPLPGV